MAAKMTKARQALPESLDLLMLRLFMGVHQVSYRIPCVESVLP